MLVKTNVLFIKTSFYQGKKQLAMKNYRRESDLSRYNKMQFQILKGSEASSQFRLFAKAKIQIQRLKFLVLLLEQRLQ